MTDQSQDQQEITEAVYGLDNEITIARKKRADHYFEDHLKNQRKWYSDQATSHKNWGWRLSVVVIAAGALIPVLQIFAEDTSSVWVAFITGMLGVIITVAKGVDRIAKFEETWVGYRKASECMKREYRLYINNAGPYTFIEDETRAYRYFVEQIEQIIAEEQNNFWQSRDTSNQTGDTTQATDTEANSPPTDQGT